MEGGSDFMFPLCIFSVRSFVRCPSDSGRASTAQARSSSSRLFRCGNQRKGFVYLFLTGDLDFMELCEFSFSDELDNHSPARAGRQGVAA